MFAKPTDREKVKHIKFGEGEVLSIKEDKIKVVFGGIVIKEFSYPGCFQDGVLKYITPFAQNPSSPKTSIDSNSNTFFCFQGLQYYHELEGEYIFALAFTSNAHWNLLSKVKVGDIIFHCYNQRIVAVSKVQCEARLVKCPKEHYLANDNKAAVGYMVKTKYTELKNPILISNYKKEIIRIQGGNEGQGYPFNKNGGGNQGYLFNLKKELANFFLQEIEKRNSSFNGFTTTSAHETQAQVECTICPICGINYIAKTATCCSICYQKPAIKSKYDNLSASTNTKKSFNDSILRVGKTVEAKTHAEFLSNLFKKEYKGFMKSSKKLADGKLLWMIELGVFISESGWINRLVSQDIITETHLGTIFDFEHNTYKHALETGQYFDDSDRVIFDVVKKNGYRSYVFRGVFRLNKTKCTLYENVWELVLSEYRI